MDGSRKRCLRKSLIFLLCAALVGYGRPLRMFGLSV